MTFPCDVLGFLSHFLNGARKHFIGENNLLLAIGFPVSVLSSQFHCVHGQSLSQVLTSSICCGIYQFDELTNFQKTIILASFGDIHCLLVNLGSKMIYCSTSLTERTGAAAIIFFYILLTVRHNFKWLPLITLLTSCHTCHAFITAVRYQFANCVES